MVKVTFRTDLRPMPHATSKFAPAGGKTGLVYSCSESLNGDLGLFINSLNIPTQSVGTTAQLGNQCPQKTG